LIHGHERTYNEIAVHMAAGACLYGSGVEVVDIIVEDDVHSALDKVLLDHLAVLVGVGRVEELRVRVDNGNLLVGERVLDLTRIF